MGEVATVAGEKNTSARALPNVAFLFAGQGSQKPGMGRELCEASAAARAVFSAADSVRPGTSDQCFTGTKEELSLTVNTQPCVLAVDLAAAEALRERGVVPAAVAGHSLGELGALAFAGALTPKGAFRLAVERATLMTACCEAHPGAMRAVLKLEPSKVEELAAQAGEAWPVNYNSPLQTVAAGSPEACEALDGLVKAARGRSVKVAVSGAFHSPYMADAADGLATWLGEHPLAQPAVPCWSNLTGGPYEGDAAAMAQTLANQVSHPVRWVDELRGMQAAGIDTFVEVGPGHTLTGLVRHTLEGVTAICVETPDQLDAAVSQILEA
ncbi:MAG: ACP S-malonyltransferase [Coriobacteriaceae bacterium]|nr:MAG: ACP S-malonyltransferase [Coriobacteriaceae bacterium]